MVEYQPMPEKEIHGLLGRMIQYTQIEKRILNPTTRAEQLLSLKNNPNIRRRIPLTDGDINNLMAINAHDFQGFIYDCENNGLIRSGRFLKR
jgi:hypothetical protein